ARRGGGAVVRPGPGGPLPRAEPDPPLPVRVARRPTRARLLSRLPSCLQPTPLRAGCGPLRPPRLAREAAGARRNRGAAGARRNRGAAGAREWVAAVPHVPAAP